MFLDSGRTRDWKLSLDGWNPLVSWWTDNADRVEHKAATSRSREVLTALRTRQRCTTRVRFSRDPRVGRDWKLSLDGWNPRVSWRTDNADRVEHKAATKPVAAL